MTATICYTTHKPTIAKCNIFLFVYLLLSFFLHFVDFYIEKKKLILSLPNKHYTKVASQRNKCETQLQILNIESVNWKTITDNGYKLKKKKKLQMKTNIKTTTIRKWNNKENKIKTNFNKGAFKPWPIEKLLKLHKDYSWSIIVTTINNSISKHKCFTFWL